MTYRQATTDDCPVLAELNHQSIRDETDSSAERRQRSTQ